VRVRSLSRTGVVSRVQATDPGMHHMRSCGIHGTPDPPFQAVSA
jgi:hypothetical protein